MMRKQLITMECLFLHDTPMAGLEKEQFLFRRFHGLTEKTALPFNFLPPFCLTADTDISGRLLVEAPQNSGGWIIRPLPQLPQVAEKPDFPGFPRLPSISGFILGYAGLSADALIGEMQKTTFGAFSVKVWYTAAMKVEIEFDEGRSYGAFHKTGPAKWHKEAR